MSLLLLLWWWSLMIKLMIPYIIDVVVTRNTFLFVIRWDIRDLRLWPGKIYPHNNIWKHNNERSMDNQWSIFESDGNEAVRMAVYEVAVRGLCTDYVLWLVLWSKWPALERYIVDPLEHVTEPLRRMIIIGVDQVRECMYFFTALVKENQLYNYFITFSLLQAFPRNSC